MTDRCDLRLRRVKISRSGASVQNCVDSWLVAVVGEELKRIDDES